MAKWGVKNLAEKFCSWHMNSPWEKKSYWKENKNVPVKMLILNKYSKSTSLLLKHGNYLPKAKFCNS